VQNKGWCFIWQRVKMRRMDLEKYFIYHAPTCARRTQKAARGSDVKGCAQGMIGWRCCARGCRYMLNADFIWINLARSYIRCICNPSLIWIYMQDYYYARTQERVEDAEGMRIFSSHYNIFSSEKIFPHRVTMHAWISWFIIQIEPQHAAFSAKFFPAALFWCALRITRQLYILFYISLCMQAALLERAALLLKNRAPKVSSLPEFIGHVNRVYANWA